MAWQLSESIRPGAAKNDVCRRLSDSQLSLDIHQWQTIQRNDQQRYLFCLDLQVSGSPCIHSDYAKHLYEQPLHCLSPYFWLCMWQCGVPVHCLVSSDEDMTQPCLAIGLSKRILCTNNCSSCAIHLISVHWHSWFIIVCLG